ncbi:MAG: hypothetical protein IT522_09995 [Burkholderiales bacterium]|nr:hypothetical protein [Burkholderiales bacterium]
MRHPLAACMLLVAACTAQAAVPVPDAMGDADARQLLLRTGFAPTAAQVHEFAALTRVEGVDRILAQTRSEASTPPPAFAFDDAPLR